MKHLFLYIVFIIANMSIIRAQNEIQLLPADTFAIHQALLNAEKQIKAGDKKEESRYYDQIGLIYWEHNYYTLAIEFYEKSLKLNTQLNNESGSSMINHNLGMIYADKANYEKSLDYFQKALNYRRMVRDKTGTIMVLINTSVTLNNLKRYDESIKNLNEALSLAREMNDMEQMKSCYGMLSETYEKAKQSDKAYYYFGLYKTFHEQLQMQKVKTVEENIKETQLQLKLTETEKLNKELELRLANNELIEKEKDISQLDATNKNLYTNLTRTELQKKLLEQDNQLQQAELKEAETQRNKQRMQIWFLLTAIVLTSVGLFLILLFYRQKNRLNKQLITQNEQINIQKDEIERKNIELEKLSIVASETSNAIMITNKNGDIGWINKGFTKMYGYTQAGFLAKGKNIFEAHTNDAVINRLLNTINQKQNTIYEAEQENNQGQKLWVQTTVTPILDEYNNIKQLVFIDSDITNLKNSEQKILAQKEEIEKQKTSLTDSINYAMLIQHAMLMSGNHFDALFADHFIVHRPKATVSGDFYWSSKVGQYIIFAAVDCTGHGVPGAFMSMIGMNLLRQITDNVQMPDQICGQMNQDIRKLLNQDNNSNRDGMDVAICTYDTLNQKLYYTGATRPIFMVQNNAFEHLRGEKKSLGGGIERNSKAIYKLNTFDITTDTTLYLFSDGITDQFDLTNERKFTVNRLRELFQENHHLPFDQQKSLLEQTLDQWQGNQAQVDDIMFLGLKIKI